MILPQAALQKKSNVIDLLARDSGRQPEIVMTAARFTGSKTFSSLILGLTPLALCLRLLRRLTQ